MNSFNEEDPTLPVDFNGRYLFVQNDYWWCKLVMFMFDNVIMIKNMNIVLTCFQLSQLSAATLGLLLLSKSSM